MESYELHICHLRCFVDYSEHISHCDAELVLCQARSDVSVCMRTHIGVQTEGDTGHLSFLSCQFVDNLQLGYALNIKTEDIIIESEIDFPISFANTGIYNLRSGETSLDRGFYLATAHTVGS